MEILQACELKKTYGTGEACVHALDGVSLNVEKGEFVAVVGTSGSGKSTLLHMLGGLDRPSSGKVFVDGKDIFSLKDEELTIFRRRKIGFVFQAYNLVPVLNVYENIVLPIELDGGKVDKEFVKKITETLGLDQRLNALPNQLSGGQQQRVAIARDQENSARIGVNWGLTASSISSGIDFSLVAALIAFFLLIIFTGYLIIYNIFQISVTGDIRFYGLLKTIGTTPRQLRRIITQEALFLCILGIPIGLLLGYGIGAVLTPIVLETTSIIGTKATISSSPLIFIGSALFAIITVFLSCRKPGKMAAKVSPVEAAKYTEGMTGKKKKRRSRGAKVYQMAFANLGRNKKKTALVIVSLTLSVTLLNVLFSLVNGFDMDKYVDRSTCADFIVSSTDYFRYNSADEYIGQDIIDEIKENTDETVAGSGYDLTGISPMMWMETDQYSKLAENYLSGEELQE